MTARLPWIRLDANLKNHPKAIELAEHLGDPRAHTYLPDLWSWASQNRPDGYITGKASVVVIETACGWRGERGELVKALVETRWLDTVENGFFIHDWEAHAGPHVLKSMRDAYGKLLTGDKKRQKAPKSVRRRFLTSPSSSSSSSQEEGVQGEKESAKALRAAWNENKPPELPAWSAGREDKVGARLKRYSLSDMLEAIRRVQASDFCRGLLAGKDWRADPDWLLKPDTIGKVLEGKYDNRGKSKAKNSNELFDLVTAEDSDAR